MNCFKCPDYFKDLDGEFCTMCKIKYNPIKTKIFVLYKDIKKVHYHDETEESILKRIEERGGEEHYEIIKVGGSVQTAIEWLIYEREELKQKIERMRQSLIETIIGEEI